MKYIVNFIMVLCVICGSSPNNIWANPSFDIRRYENSWHGTADWSSAYGRSENVEMIITITTPVDGGKQEISWEVNGKKLENVEYEYLYSQLPNRRPFIYLYALDGEHEHMFYGTLYSEASWDDGIRGVYEFVSPCRISGEPLRCGEVFPMEFLAEIDKYDGHK